MSNREWELAIEKLLHRIIGQCQFGREALYEDLEKIRVMSSGTVSFPSIDKWLCRHCGKTFNKPVDKLIDYHKREFVDSCPHCGWATIILNS